jgi:hypothetical protein
MTQCVEIPDGSTPPVGLKGVKFRYTKHSQETNFSARSLENNKATLDSGFVEEEKVSIECTLIPHRCELKELRKIRVDEPKPKLIKEIDIYIDSHGEVFETVKAMMTLLPNGSHTFQ